MQRFAAGFTLDKDTASRTLRSPFYANFTLEKDMSLEIITALGPTRPRSPAAGQQCPAHPRGRPAP